MGEVIIGSDAVLAGVLTRAALRWNYRAIYPDIYVPREADVTLATRTRGAWLWSNRRGVLTGLAAANLHGSLWVPDDAPVEMIWANNRPPSGIATRRARIAPGEITRVDGMPVATPARTGLDLGRHLPRHRAVAHIDALARATGVTGEAILELTDRYRGSHGVKRCREAVALMNAGAQSPQESRLRVLLRDNGFPVPETQIPLFTSDGRIFAYLDMGWRDRKIAVEYDGEQHRTSTEQYRWDVRRLRLIEALGWILIRVIAGDRDFEVLEQVRRAFAMRAGDADLAQPA